MSTKSVKLKDDDTSDKVNLQKSISLLSACAIIIGTIVGSGIFVTPKSILENSGSFSVSLIVWLVSGLIALIGAICYTELGTLIQTSGGDYAYINLSYGSFWSFLYTWMTVFVTIPAYNAVSARTVAEYLLKLFLDDCADYSGIIKLFGVIFLCFLGFMNSLNITFVSRIQTVFTITKILTFIVVIGGGIWSSVNTKNQDVFDEWLPNENKFQWSKLATAFYSSLFAYSGWNSLNFLTEELKNANKNLPRAVMIAIPSVIVIFMLTNISYFIVLTPQEVANSETIAITFSGKVFRSGFSFLLPLFIAFSTFGSLSSSVLGYSRVYYAAARDGNLPEMFALINVKYFSPITSILLITVLSIAMLLLADIEKLILYASFSEILFIALSVSAILYLRKKMPDAQRPIKVFIGLPILFLIVCVFLNGLTFYDQPKESLVGLGFLAVGVPVYFLAIVWKNKPKKFTDKLGSFNTICSEIISQCQRRLNYKSFIFRFNIKFDNFEIIVTYTVL